MEKPLPHFELAPPMGIDPNSIDVDTELGAFVLVLANIYNDLKGLALASQLVVDARPTAETKLAVLGQVSGLQIQINRLGAGIIHELMEKIEEHQNLIETKEFGALIARIPNAAARRSWRGLCAVAVGSPAPAGRDPDRLMLVKLRNNVAFHYSTKALAKGYRRHFHRLPKVKYADRAVFSDGDSMEGTRFYFADAAAKEALPELTGLDDQTLIAKLGRFTQSVNFALKHIVVAYILRMAAPTPYTGS
jgi:hypothetical protein